LETRPRNPATANGTTIKRKFTFHPSHGSGGRTTTITSMWQNVNDLQS
jgi:hypothetical protein